MSSLLLEERGVENRDTEDSIRMSEKKQKEQITHM